jgi:hypothetical protein
VKWLKVKALSSNPSTRKTTTMKRICRLRTLNREAKYHGGTVQQGNTGQ